MRWPWRRKPEPVPLTPSPAVLRISQTALSRAERKLAHQEIEPYVPPPGVIPPAERARALAQDATPYDYVNQAFANCFFQGYQFLAMLAQLPEYRKISEIRAKEMTRKWIKLSSTGEGDKTEKLARLDAALKRYRVQEVFTKCAELDGLFGRAQVYLDLKAPDKGILTDADKALPLILDPRTVGPGALVGLRVIEPIWTYPAAYNTTDPLGPDYYRPLTWYVMGKTIHDSRLLLFVSRPLPDLLKAAYNFGGLSMSQMAQPYVQNWYRTRDSVSDLVHSFSVSGVKTNLSAMLAGTDQTQFLSRAEMFNKLRDNRGLMMIDKDTEDFFQINTPLSGLDALQAQAQEQMSSVASIPLIKLLGITPTGLNASSEGEIKVFETSINADQEILLRPNLEIILKVIQLSEFGEIDPAIGFEFEPLSGMTDTEKATVQKAKADTDAALVTIGAVSPNEVRGRLAADPDSGYNNLEVDDDPDLDERHEDLEAKARINDE